MTQPVHEVRRWGHGYAIFRDGARLTGARTKEDQERAMDRLMKPKRVRPCIRCGDEFRSEGAHHRMCQPCRAHASDIFDGAV